MLKKRHIKSRLDLAKTDLQYEDDYFKKNLWSDESRIKLFDQNDATHVWREDGAAYSQKSTTPTINYGCRNIMVCGGFAYSGPEELIIIGSTME